MPGGKFHEFLNGHPAEFGGTPNDALSSRKSSMAGRRAVSADRLPMPIRLRECALVFEKLTDDQARDKQRISNSKEQAPVVLGGGNGNILDSAGQAMQKTERPPGNQEPVIILQPVRFCFVSRQRQAVAVCRDHLDSVHLEDQQNAVQGVSPFLLCHCKSGPLDQPAQNS